MIIMTYSKNYLVVSAKSINPFYKSNQTYYLTCLNLKTIFSVIVHREQTFLRLDIQHTKQYLTRAFKNGNLGPGIPGKNGNSCFLIPGDFQFRFYRGSSRNLLIQISEILHKKLILSLLLDFFCRMVPLKYDRSEDKWRQFAPILTKPG